MSELKLILKQAFIDSKVSSSKPCEHSFSEEFEENMERLIKSQSGLRRLVNTTAKKVACVFLAILICFTTVACSVKEIREPIIDEIKKFVVNAKEILSGTYANEVSYLFPTDITKIVGTSYISKYESQYVIDEREQITAFVKLLSETHWGIPEKFDEFEGVGTYWTFDFYDSNGKSAFQIKLCNEANYNRSQIAIIKDGEENHFYISNKVYKEILAFTNQKLYLHNSPLTEPDTAFFQKKQSDAFEGMGENEIKEVKKRIRKLHYEIEYFLMSNVSLLKERDSIYWEYVINEKAFTDPISKAERKYDMRRIFINETEYIISLVRHKETKDNLSKALNLFKQSVAEHNLSGLFEVHEYIHDYDYYAFNYPTAYVYSEYADYQGLDDYFGRLEVAF